MFASASSTSGPAATPRDDARPSVVQRVHAISTIRLHSVLRSLAVVAVIVGSAAYWPRHGLSVAAVFVTAVAGWSDARASVVPNWLTLSTLFTAPAVHAVLAYHRMDTLIWMIPGGRWAPLLAASMSIAAAALCAFTPALLFRMRAAGAGDVKLTAALGALLGSTGLGAEFFALVLVALYVPAALAYRGLLFRTLWSLVLLSVRPLAPRAVGSSSPELFRPVRFAPALFVGTLVSIATHGISSVTH